MCDTVDGAAGWQAGPPDSEGDWLWLSQWSCGCVHRSGIAWATRHRVSDGQVELRGGADPLYLSWEAEPRHRPHGGHAAVDPMAVVSWWMKLELPTPRD